MLFIYKMFVNYSQLQFGLFCKMMINLKLNSIHKHIYTHIFLYFYSYKRNSINSINHLLYFNK